MMVAECAFCAIVAGATPATTVATTDEAVAFLDTRPVFRGHVLVVPRRHLTTLADVPAPLLGPLFEFVQRLAVAVEAGLGAGGTFVAMNNKVSQSVPHLHVHVVPRTRGDGLRGFFWPRTRYASAGQAREYADRIAAALDDAALDDAAVDDASDDAASEAEVPAAPPSGTSGTAARL